jgi:RNA polymerase sigma-70 factor, ECF subfamily
MDETLDQLEQHYVETGPMLLAYFRRQRPLNGMEDDLLQETFIQALRHRERLQRAVSCRAYLFGIARHVTLDALRRLRPAVELPDEFPAEPVPDEDPRLGALRAAITRLPPLHREPLLLKLREELSYEEIAEVLALPAGTVRSRLHYAVAQLEKMLNPAAASPASIPAHHET